ncbi:KilA-N domain-containing protein [Rufibacter sediminis]|uniref:KilA-N domain-containing protein n=1 Tax=Rufibacter sediminis TaxID=2762756 RepID=A0ABR6VUY7_9BACT|nr:KilA-N domain-containing protein [Rufibacter sediminis]
MSTIEFVNALSKKLKVRILPFKIVKGRHHSGTWMHKTLVIKFAGWLNPEFKL